MGTRKAILAAVLVGFAVVATQSGAQRAGDGKTTSATKPSSSSSTEKKPDDKKEPGAPVNVTPRANTGTAASRRQATPAAAGAPAGAAAGTAAPAVEPGPSTEELARRRSAELERVRKRFDDDVKLRKADEERKAQEDLEKAIAAKQQRESQEAQKRAAFERERERERERKRLEQERQAQCVITPVMSDDDIAKCRAARGG